jgi:NTP pyrophosphatase (non-canonical NTP hydrolase)
MKDNCPICEGKGDIEERDSEDFIIRSSSCELCKGTGKFENKLKIMTIEKYQGIIEKTAIYPKEMGLQYTVLGLCGESGEVAEKVKKLYRDNNGKMDEYFKQNLSKELGDVLWYVTASLNEIGVSLEECMQQNYDKLTNRRKTQTLHGSGDDRELTRAGKEL